MLWKIIVIISIFIQMNYGQRVEKQPNLLDSFIPASMQIIAHITELMKYDLKPTTTDKPQLTTTTLRPTQSHNPGIYAPHSPPGPVSYFSKSLLSYDEYVERLKNPSGYYTNYFDRYRQSANQPEQQQQQQPEVEVVYKKLLLNDEEVPQNLDLVVGKGPSDLVKLIFDQDDDVEEEEGIEKFSRNYDDDHETFNHQLLRQKKVPPTRAYVGLLSLYDLLNKESKKLGLNKYNGYSQAVLTELVNISTDTSAYQLKSVLNKISQRRDTKNQQIIKRIDELVKDLENSSSYISTALRYIPPLPFVL